MLAFLILGCMPLQFEVEGTTAIMTGDLTSNAPNKVAQLIEEYPNLEWIELLDCPGSMDDVSAFEAARLIRAAGINTRVPSDGEIYSGAVDFFIAGVERQVKDGGIVGVHSWSDGSVEGSELPKDHSEHDLYKTFYEDMGISEDFYWFTLQAASSSGIHEMTREELVTYSLVTD